MVLQVKRSAKIAIFVVAAAAIAFAGLRVRRGPTGASRDYGGELEASISQPGSRALGERSSAGRQ
jgi:hypothetical protein